MGNLIHLPPTLAQLLKNAGITVTVKVSTTHRFTPEDIKNARALLVGWAYDHLGPDAAERLMVHLAASANDS
jgi:hypothetical protein